MRAGSFLTLLLATLLAVAAAAVVLTSGPDRSVDTATGAPAFPALIEAPEAVHEIEVTAAGESFTLARNENNRWVLPAHGGFPADQSQVRLLLQGLSKLTLYQPKTALEERLPRLWLEDPAAPDSKGARVTLRDGEGAVLADAVLGRTSNDLLGTVEGGIYIRFGTQTQAWLAAGKLPVPGKLLDMLDRSIVSLPDDTIRSVAVTHPDGNVILAERDSADLPMTLQSGLAEGQSPDPKAVARLAALVETLLFEDVQPSDSVSFPAETVLTTVTSFDGIELTFELARVDGQPWLRLEPALAARHSDNPDHLAGAKGFIEKLRGKVGGWSYRIGEGLWKRLAVTPDSLLPKG